jgi:tight adherence protein C
MPAAGVLMLVGAALVIGRPALATRVPTRIAELRDGSGRGRTRFTFAPLASVARRAAAWVGHALCRPLSRPVGPAVETAVGAAVLTAAAVAAFSPAVALPAAGLVAAWPWWRARTRRRRRAAEVVDGLPLVVDLFRLAAGAGLSVHLAVPAVARRAPERFGRALDEVVDRERVGESLADALGRFARLGDAVRPLVAALLATERDGSPLAPALDRVAFEARLASRHRAEEAARRLPVRLLLPLVACILPAFGLLTVVPLVVASLPHLSS